KVSWSEAMDKFPAGHLVAGILDEDLSSTLRKGFGALAKLLRRTEVKGRLHEQPADQTKCRPRFQSGRYTPTRIRSATFLPLRRAAARSGVRSWPTLAGRQRPVSPRDEIHGAGR